MAQHAISASRMIVIFGSRYDESSYALAARWSQEKARVLTCEDLSIAGWRHYLPAEDKHTAIIDREVVSLSEIKGVLIRWPGVFEKELSQIAEVDRDYVAREMMAFLVSWFSTLNCPVVNQPTPVNLVGPGWSLEQWTYVAAQVGMQVPRVERHVRLGSVVSKNDLSPMTSEVTVIGNRCFGDVEESLRRQSLRLAEAAGVSLLRISFSGSSADSKFLDANLLPSLNDPQADAVLEYLMEQPSA